MNQDVKEALADARTIRNLIKILNRLDNDDIRLHADEQQALAAARIRYAALAAYLHRMGESVNDNT